MKKKDLELIKEAKALGAKSIKIGDIEITFANDAEIIKTQVVQELSPEDIVKPLSEMDDLTEEEVLYYATPFYDELQKQKKQRAEAIKNGVIDG